MAAAAAGLFVLAPRRWFPVAVGLVISGLALVTFLALVRRPDIGLSLLASLGAPPDRVAVLAWWTQIIGGWVGAPLLAAAGVGLLLVDSLRAPAASAHTSVAPAAQVLGPSEDLRAACSRAADAAADDLDATLDAHRAACPADRQGDLSQLTA